MATAVKTEIRPPATMSDEEFIAFYDRRPRGERWQLIDGDVVMMTPPKLRHQWIGGNLAMALNTHFWEHRPELRALHEIGIIVPGVPRFRPTCDVGVIDDRVDLDTSWADRFLLVTEVLSDSNTPKQIERKRQRYVQHPDNLYVLVIAQLEVRVDVWSRRTDWQLTALTGLDDKLELPEFGFSMPLSRLYAGTPLGQT